MTSSKLINHPKRILAREEDQPITIKEKLKRDQMFVRQQKRIWEITIMAMPE